ncbi:LRR receptor-like serine threonine-protein kinase [Seminavis robusta]|uniref:LRR receptor-like serine threonine-protein kinase n=1 Tax=Seminavis robusta TaxID=568900 RepID=A0A9N8HEC5_9STRA|nr:LRR receptor-like serine threonine-protein kinase [Seminavis robusta]|eukprot:Sro298_g111150.1 LRR receptor-like serine threonine-protein kinase (502) ;mRNA; f:50377-51882
MFSSRIPGFGGWSPLPQEEDNGEQQLEMTDFHSCPSSLDKQKGLFSTYRWPTAASANGQGRLRTGMTVAVTVVLVISVAASIWKGTTERLEGAAGEGQLGNSSLARESPSPTTGTGSIPIPSLPPTATGAPRQEPPASPTSTAIAVARSFLPPYTLEAISRNASSLQAQALAWLGDHHPEFNEGMPGWRKQQLVALATGRNSRSWIAGQIAQGTGDSIPNSAKFGCWKVKTYHLPPEIGLLTSLTRINFGMGRPRGRLPSELGLLTELTFLSLFSNYMTGTLPQELWRLSKLDELTLFSNRFRGPLYSEMGLMTALTHLSLSMNDLTGTIPQELQKMTAMESLYLGGNQFTGALPTLGNMTSLVSFELFGNPRLTGTVSPWFLRSASNLKYLEILNTSLTASIPSELCLLTSLRTLRLFDNPNFTGTVPPSCLASFSDLEILQLDRTSMTTGSLPSELGLLTAMQELYLQDNPSLTGTIPPPVVASMRNLTYLTRLSSILP